MLPQLSSLFGRRLRIVLDTNVLLLPGQGTDIFTAIEHAVLEPYDLFAVQSTYVELKRIIDGEKKVKGSEKFNAKLGFILANQKQVRQLKDKAKTVDDSLVAYADDRTVIFTLDRQLRGRIKGKGCKVMTLKGKSVVIE